MGTHNSDRLHIAIPVTTFETADQHARSFHMLFSSYSRRALSLGFKLEELRIPMGEDFVVNGEHYTPPPLYVPRRGQPKVRRDLYVPPETHQAIRESSQAAEIDFGDYIVRRLDLLSDLVEFGLSDLLLVKLEPHVA